jgi:hypothetical protein
MSGRTRGQRCCPYRVRIGGLLPGPPLARGRSGVAHNGHLRSSGCSACSRGWPAEPVAHPAARRGERDPERIADDHEEQGGWRWQAHRHGASRPVTVTDYGRRPGGGAQAHSPHHVPVHWLPGHQDHRGQNDCQRPHGKRDSRMSGRPCVLHPSSLGPRRLAGRTMVDILLARSAATRISMIWQSVTSGPATAGPGLTPSRRSGCSGRERR